MEFPKRGGGGNGVKLEGLRGGKRKMQPGREKEEFTGTCRDIN